MAMEGLVKECDEAVETYPKSAVRDAHYFRNANVLSIMKILVMAQYVHLPKN